MRPLVGQTDGAVIVVVDLNGGLFSTRNRWIFCRACWNRHLCFGIRGSTWPTGTSMAGRYRSMRMDTG